MTEQANTACVFVPCSDSECWAVPQSCLAEIQVVNSTSEDPPDRLEWRGHDVPVVDFGQGGSARWRERRVGTGLVAIFLGLNGENCDYWGVAIRGEGLDLVSIPADELTDAADEAVEHAVSAFKYNDNLYQIPDLDGLQRDIAARTEAA